MTSEEMVASTGTITDREQAYAMARLEMLRLRGEMIEANTTSQLKPCQVIEFYERVRGKKLLDKSN